MPDKEKLLKNKTFCMIPWTHLHTWPDGRVLTCCMTHMDDSMGNLKDMTLEQAWNSTQQKQLRKDFDKASILQDYDRHNLLSDVREIKSVDDILERMLNTLLSIL